MHYVCFNVIRKKNNLFGCLLTHYKFVFFYVTISTELISNL